MAERYCAAFVHVIELCDALGVSKINALPGCWEHQIDDQWWVAVNAKKQPVVTSRGYTVEPYDCFVEYNGFPAGSFNPGGGILAAGEAANEQTFIAAVRAAIERAREVAHA